MPARSECSTHHSIVNLSQILLLQLACPILRLVWYLFLSSLFPHAPTKYYFFIFLLVFTTSLNILFYKNFTHCSFGTLNKKIDDDSPSRFLHQSYMSKRLDYLCLLEWAFFNFLYWCLLPPLFSASPQIKSMQKYYSKSMLLKRIDIDTKVFLFSHNYLFYPFRAACSINI